jgi:hypothetical protein
MIRTCERIYAQIRSSLIENVTQLLNAVEAGDVQATDKLLPLVYDELRRLAEQKLRHPWSCG